MNQIGDYALIGDCHSLSLVGSDGSIDWCCFPRFESPSMFARMLDAQRGGHFKIAPEARVTEVQRRYLPATNVLHTVFDTDDGRLEVTDCMPVGRFDPARPAAVDAHHSILRRVRCTAGTVTARVTIEPRFEYAAVVPRFTPTSPTTASVVGGPDALWVRVTRPFGGDGDRITAGWSLTAGDEEWVETAWTPAAGADPLTDPDPRAAMAARLADTTAFWEGWFGCCSYAGEYARKVHRSALLLKALTYAPTGAVIAAGTTSLPEWIGGERNWDYRFTWIRDATLTLTSLVILGYLPEADAFKGWLERTGAGRPDDLQIMYRITGQRLLPEVTLDHLDGHRGSAPVRVGNGAAGQLQLDSFGQLVEAGYLFIHAGGELTPSNGEFLARVADLAATGWRYPDQGIWEIRDEPRHFTHSKLNCWVALDRAVRMARGRRPDTQVDRWAAERDQLAAWLRSEGSPDGWFVQAGGRSVADAATLLVPALGFAAPADPAVLKTVDVVDRDLGQGVLLHRYLDPDGLAGPEGSFLLCSFWLIDALIAAGRVDEAEERLGQVLALANDVGMFAEMVDPASGEQLGNTPQAFTHMAVVSTCEMLTAAKAGQLPSPDERYAFAHAALERRLGSP
ncbi:MAG: glycoside hydrolase family 15 protein [Acidimicrobiia bacterium]|nr:glycoside hydrolase family 15 protein [Acidimicrobiia bacterium]